MRASILPKTDFICPYLGGKKSTHAFKIQIRQNLGIVQCESCKIIFIVNTFHTERSLSTSVFPRQITEVL